MIIFSLLISLSLAAYAPDKVANLPGLNFTPLFDHYSGFLQASDTNFFHYWLTESIRSPKTAPLMLWLGGGPGCTAIGNLLKEMGPFHLMDFGNTVYFNKYSWNQFANVLFIDSPAHVGYSYSTDGTIATDDNQTSLHHYNALLDFFSKFPEYKARELYITGQSYAGIYLPTLGVRMIKDTVNFPNFRGMAIGNGLLDVYLNSNTLIPLYYYHGLIRDELYNRIRSECCKGNIESCDLTNNISGGQACVDMVNEAMNAIDGNVENPMNLYSTCYLDGQGSATVDLFAQNILREALGVSKALPPLREDTPLCAQTNNPENYMNRADVRKALHVPSSLPHWYDCNGDVNNAYQRIYNDMYQQVKDINAAGVRKNNLLLERRSEEAPVVFYTGDVDTVCNHVQTMGFLTNLTQGRTILGEEKVGQRWTYNGESPNVAGRILQYSGNIDYLTVKGGGHLVMLDKPREGQQLYYNWINGLDYSQPLPFTP